MAAYTNAICSMPSLLAVYGYKLYSIIPTKGSNELGMNFLLLFLVPWGTDSQHDGYL